MMMKANQIPSIAAISTTAVWTGMTVYKLGLGGDRDAWILALSVIAFVAVAWAEAWHLRQFPSATRSILAITSFAAVVFMFLSMGLSER
jgi:hypothetical protein